MENNELSEREKELVRNFRWLAEEDKWELERVIRYRANKNIDMIYSDLRREGFSVIK